MILGLQADAFSSMPIGDQAKSSAGTSMPRCDQAKCLLMIFDRFVQGVKKEELWKVQSLTEAWNQIQEQVRQEQEQGGGDEDEDDDPDRETELNQILARTRKEDE